MKNAMLRSVRDTPELVLGLHYSELEALHLNWQGYLPLVHPGSLRVITVVHVSCPDAPDPWVRADVQGGKLVNIGRTTAKDVAILERAIPPK